MTSDKTIELGKARIGKNMRVYAIGDIHGCLAELKKLFKIIKKDLAERPIKKHRIIFIGDYVDRGPDCKGVIDYLIDLKMRGENVTFLLGNHEEKLIRVFTDIDRRSMPGFFRYGGLETLASYGLPAETIETILGDAPRSKDLKKLSTMVKKHLGKAHVKFLSKLKTSTTQGDYFFCHAGIDPSRSFHDQDDYELVWMREPFLSWPRPLQKVVVHGHTPRSTPEAMPHRINVDTGCVYGRMLTAVVLEKKSHHFLQVKAKYKYRKGD
ncbi:MAG: serine/threonine protein phosphatase [Rhizobiaceae bacterium]|nr:serine/threonine protein phosphatase [Rhizobiaceae bacterium]